MTLKLIIFTLILIKMNRYIVADLFEPSFLIKYHNNPNGGLAKACRGGHRDLVDFMIQKGATDWNWGLKGACQGGNRDLVDLMIEKGATHWDRALREACLGGHPDLADFMIQKGADYRVCPNQQHCHPVK
jgi:hypothetical protein